MPAEPSSDTITRILERNARVEADKAWETSKTRRAIIAFSTYLCAVLFLHLINAPNPFLNAVVPSGAYLLSTLALPFAKQRWLQARKTKA
ncbi:TPA: hypothetical protein HA318_04350 [Candidatus Micrarchaeota archaeon]|nr:MAG: hypothetical protein AUJ65_01400 [Candidatus Micrarchaeota archaeon CG1_02_51_15]HII39203.1 hypothetical protein [Candidatus Micrarchaeota archaeon]